MSVDSCIVFLSRIGGAAVASSFSPNVDGLNLESVDGTPVLPGINVAGVSSRLGQAHLRVAEMMPAWIGVTSVRYTPEQQRQKRSIKGQTLFLRPLLLLREPR